MVEYKEGKRRKMSMNQVRDHGGKQSILVSFQILKKVFHSMARLL